MLGATEYARMFKTGQYGRLFLVSGSHARGETFHIWILPSDIKIDRDIMPWSVKDAVEVYGITGGRPGWTETYGWLHNGRWQHDFAELVEKRRAEMARDAEQKQRDENMAEHSKRQRTAELLAKY